MHSCPRPRGSVPTVDVSLQATDGNGRSFCHKGDCGKLLGTARVHHRIMDVNSPAPVAAAGVPETGCRYLRFD